MHLATEWISIEREREKERERKRERERERGIEREREGYSGGVHCLLRWKCDNVSHTLSHHRGRKGFVIRLFNSPGSIAETLLGLRAFHP